MPLRLLLILISLTATTHAADPAPTWWSFTPPIQPPVPKTHTNPIDAFVRQKLATKNLTHSPQAKLHTRIRRLYLVMLGVPPTPDELADKADWPILVDRVLDDPRYGERWAQHWLDIVRWAETVGFETNLARPNAWPYRDYVISSLNADKPYDRFVAEQIAGDILDPDNPVDPALGFLVAGPANLPGQIGRDTQAMRQARQDELDEVIRTVSQSILGLTVGCARCHDHKFDPITAGDYYSLQAIFSSLRYGDRRHRGPANDAWTAKIPGIQNKLTHRENELENLRLKHALRPPLNAVQTESFPPVTARAIRINIAATRDLASASLYELEAWSAADAPKNVALASAGAGATASSFALENQTRHPDCLNDGSVDKRQAFPWRAGAGGPAWARVDFARPATIDRVVWHQGYSLPADYSIEILPADSGVWQEVAHTRDRLPRWDDTRPAGRIQLAGLTAEQTTNLAAAVAAVRTTRAELARFSAGPKVYAASFPAAPEPTYLLERGDPMRRTSLVKPGVPDIIGDLDLAADAPDPDRRLALARHLTNPQHPLTSRVAVNRIWHHHFGTGIVSTPSDFGAMGSPPSHPELLDWLAADFVGHGWSIKHLHRRILTSATFQQSSRPHPDGLDQDAGSRLLWRFPPRRVEAEVIRDSILATSGKLNPKAGGIGFDFFRQQGGLSDYTPHPTFDENGWRRMVYARKIRMQAIDVFGAFDCPDAGQLKATRTRSITPVQALGLLNSPFANRQATFFAERVRTESAPGVPAQIAHAILLAYSRPATPPEIEHLTPLAESHGLGQVCRALFNTSEFIYLP